jgi:hypothetical protein
MVVVQSEMGGKRVGNFGGAPINRDAPINRELRYTEGSLLTCPAADFGQSIVSGRQLNA